MRLLTLVVSSILSLSTFAQFLDTCDVSLSFEPASCNGEEDGSLTVVTGSGGPFQYSWDGGPLVNDATISELGAGSYSVFVIDTINFCSSLLDTVIPTASIYLFGGYCPGEIPTISVQNFWGFQSVVYEWSTGDSTSTIYLPEEFVGQVSLTTSDAAGCEIFYQVDVFERPAPTAEILLPDTACEMTLVPLTTVSTDADTVVWSWQNGQAFNFNDRAVFTESAYQHVTWQGFYLDGCPNIPMLDSIYINAQTPAIFTAEQIPCSKFVELRLGSNTDSCAFFIGDSLYFDICNGYILWDAPEYAVYDFTLYATQPNHCDDTLAISVDVRTEPTLFLANAFSPDGDNINELWPVNLDLPDTGYEVEIFDRWGTKMWRTTDTKEQWDGTYGGAPAPIGVYVYTMRHRDPCELTREVSKRGHLTIVR